MANRNKMHRTASNGPSITQGSAPQTPRYQSASGLRNQFKTNKYFPGKKTPDRATLTRTQCCSTKSFFFENKVPGRAVLPPDTMLVNKKTHMGPLYPCFIKLWKQS